MNLTKLTWKVIEDNEGGLHLGVFSGEKLIYCHSGYTRGRGGLCVDLRALAGGADPVTDVWDGNEIKNGWKWNEEDRRNGRWELVVDGYHITTIPGLWSERELGELVEKDKRFIYKS